jgi:hypothetical protein
MIHVLASIDVYYGSDACCARGHNNTLGAARPSKLFKLLKNKKMF